MTAIEWTDETWNPTVGCRRVSPGCKNCYAEHAAAMVNRTQGKRSAYLKVIELVDGDPRWTGVGNFLPDRLDTPLHWKKPRRAFVDSMSDLFYEAFTNEQIAAVFGVMAATPHHTYQVLTKRPERMRAWFEWAEHADIQTITCGALDEAGFERGCGSAFEIVDWPLPNVWLGVSVEDVKHGKPRIDVLRDVPAAVRFLSVEPLLEHLGTIDLRGIGWVIVGCESGAGMRPMPSDAARSIRDQCAAAGVPFFLKQATVEGTWDGDNEYERTVLAGKGSHKKPGGGNVIGAPYLDGVQHLAFPIPRAA